jgi:hypothetical protein
MFKITITALFALTAVACGGSVAPQPTDDFYYSHSVTGIDQDCAVLRSTDPTMVRLEGETCNAEGTSCTMGPGVEVQVWQTDEAEIGTPFGSASYVALETCEE